MISFEDVRPAAQRLYRTRDGELVLEHFLDRFYHCRIKDETLERQVGQRDVMLYLRQLLEDQNV